MDKQPQQMSPHAPSGHVPLMSNALANPHRLQQYYGMQQHQLQQHPQYNIPNSQGLTPENLPNVNAPDVLQMMMYNHMRTFFQQSHQIQDMGMSPTQQQAFLQQQQQLFYQRQQHQPLQPGSAASQGQPWATSTNGLGAPSNIQSGWHATTQNYSHGNGPARKRREKPPKKKKNSFLTYCDQKRPELKKQRNNLDAKQMQSILGEMWRRESDSVKLKFQQLATQHSEDLQQDGENLDNPTSMQSGTPSNIPHANPHARPHAHQHTHPHPHPHVNPHPDPHAHAHAHASTYDIPHQHGSVPMVASDSFVGGRAVGTSTTATSTTVPASTTMFPVTPTTTNTNTSTTTNTNTSVTSTSPSPSPSPSTLTSVVLTPEIDVAFISEETYSGLVAENKHLEERCRVMRDDLVQRKELMRNLKTNTDVVLNQFLKSQNNTHTANSPDDTIAQRTDETSITNNNNYNDGDNANTNINNNNNNTNSISTTTNNDNTTTNNHTTTTTDNDDDDDNDNTTNTYHPQTCGSSIHDSNDSVSKYNSLSRLSDVWKSILEVSKKGQVQAKTKMPALAQLKFRIALQLVRSSTNVCMMLSRSGVVMKSFKWCGYSELFNDTDICGYVPPLLKGDKERELTRKHCPIECFLGDSQSLQSFEMVLFSSIKGTNDVILTKFESTPLTSSISFVSMSIAWCDCTSPSIPRTLDEGDFPCAIFSRDCVFADVNTAWQRATGYSRDQCLTQSLSMLFVYPDEFQAELEDIISSAKDGEVCSKLILTNNLRSKACKLCYVQATQLASDPNMVVVVMSCRAPSTKDGELLVTRMRSPAIVVGRDSRIREVNDNWLSICSFTREETVGSTLKILQRPETFCGASGHNLKRLMQACSDRQPTRVTLQNFTKYGHSMINHVITTPVGQHDFLCVSDVELEVAHAWQYDGDGDDGDDANEIGGNDSRAQW